MKSSTWSHLFSAAIGACAFCTAGLSASAAPFVQTNLVSNIAGLASITDPDLVNPWGFSHSATSPFWISDQGTNRSTLYAVTNGTTVSKTNVAPNGFVAIPTTAGGPQGPTGQVNNTNTTAFLVNNGGNGQTGRFIFADLNGTISAWNGGATAFTQATTVGAIYTGLAINQAQTQLYAANNAAGSIDVFNSAFAPINLGAGTFATPAAVLALGLVPFNVQDIGGSIYVTYAPAGRPASTNAALGQGAVVVFNESGGLIQTFVGGALASPWGITFAPAGFGAFGGDLLVANFSFLNSAINAYDPVTGALQGTIAIDPGLGNTAGGLWAIGFGVGGNNGSPNVLYFADAINGERDGLFGAISVAAAAAVPEPSSLMLLTAGLALLGAFRIVSREMPRRRDA